MRRFSTGKPFRKDVTGVKPVSVIDLANRFAEAGDVPKVKELIEPLLSDKANDEKKNLKPRFLYNLVLKAFANIGDLQGAEAWYARMSQAHVVPSQRTFGKLVKCCATAGAADAAEAWLRRGWSGGSVSVAQLVSVMDALARAGDGHRAEAWLQRLELIKTERSERSEHGGHGDGRDVEIRASRAGKGASAMAWAHLGDLRKTALSTSATLSHQNFDKVQWVALLDACAKSSNASKAVEYFQLGLDFHLEPCVVTYTPLIDAFARSKNGPLLKQQNVRDITTSSESKVKRLRKLFWPCAKLKLLNPL